MNDEKIVRVAVVPDEIAADLACSLLRTEDIPCSHETWSTEAEDPSILSASPGEPIVGSGGVRGIYVHAHNRARAEELLAGITDET
jgi:hypothetical protein